MEYTVWAQRQINQLGSSAPKVARGKFDRREEQLRKDGFLPWERFWLCQHNINSPAMKLMRNDRREFRKNFGVTFENWNEYQKAIKQMYKDRGWYFHDGRPSPFKALEWYRSESDAAETPQAKKRRFQHNKGYIEVAREMRKSKR
jgi:hypothetical protein